MTAPWRPTVVASWRSKVAAVLILFFIGLFGGRLADLLHALGGKVEEGAAITDQIRATVTTLEQLDTAALEAQIADLQARLAQGTATRAQVASLQTLVGRLRAGTGPPGGPGPPGPAGAAGPPGAAAPPDTTSSTTSPAGPGRAPPTTRPSNTTTTTRPATTTTTRCVVGLGQLLKVGCS